MAHVSILCTLFYIFKALNAIALGRCTVLCFGLSHLCSEAGQALCDLQRFFVQICYGFQLEHSYKVA